MSENETIEWLMENGGPIIRFRTANELIRDIPLEQHMVLLKELLECEEVKKWLSNLESSVHIHSSKDSAAENCIAKLVAYGLTARFQRFCLYREFHGSYTWNREKRTCHSSAEMPYLFGYFGFDDAQFCPHKFLLYLDLTSRLPGAASIPWFRNGLEHLEQYRTDTDRYMFPKKYVPERKNGYYLYAGARMRLGEKGREGLEIESTFRMLSMKVNAGLL